METTEKTIEKLMVKKPSDIQLNEETFNSITNLIKSNSGDWKIVGGNIDVLPSIMKLNLPLITSLNKKKQIKKRICFLERKVTIKKINNLLSEVGLDYIKFEISDKEREIIQSRLNYLKIKKDYEKALQDYKSTKGDYYKNKI